MDYDIGGKLREAREAQNLSLRSVASAVGVSASLLSQVETGKTQPSVSTLYSIVTHLGLSLDALMGHEPVISPATTVMAEEGTREGSDQVVQRHADNPTIDMENGVTWERLAVGNTEFAAPIMVTYAPGGSSSVEGQPMKHEAIEYGVLIEGELTLLLEGTRYQLHPGDSFCFDAEREHLYINSTANPARGVWFVLDRNKYPVYQVESGSGVKLNAGRIESAVDVLNAMKTFDSGR